MDEQSRPFLYDQLCKLRLCLGNPKYDVSRSINYILAKSSLNNESRHELVVLNNLRLRFEEMQLTGNSRNKDLMEYRANLCMHLYRQLAGLEPDENKRYNYLKLCYELLDAGEPDNMTEEETMDYRLKVIDSLNSQVNKLLKHLNEVEKVKEKSRKHGRISKRSKPVISKTKVDGYARIDPNLQKRCEFQGLTHQSESLVTTNIVNHNTNIDNYKKISHDCETKLFGSSKPREEKILKSVDPSPIRTTIENQFISSNQTSIHSTKSKSGIIDNYKKINHDCETKLFDCSTLSEEKILKSVDPSRIRTTIEHQSISYNETHKNFKTSILPSSTRQTAGEDNLHKLSINLKNKSLKHSSINIELLSREMSKYKDRSDLLNICQSNHILKPTPMRIELKIECYLKKEPVIQRYCYLRGIIYQYGCLVILELKEKYQYKTKVSKDQDSMLKVMKNLCLDVKNSKRSVAEEFAGLQFGENPIPNCIRDEGQAKNMLNLPKNCKLQARFQSSGCIDIDDEMRQMDESLVVNGEKLIKFNDSNMHYNSTEIRTIESLLNQNETVDKSNRGSSKSDFFLIKKENGIFNGYESKKVSISNLTDFKKEFENYNVQLDELQCIQTSLSNTLINGEQSDYISDVSLDRPILSNFESESIYNADNILEQVCKSLESLTLHEKSSKAVPRTGNYLTTWSSDSSLYGEYIKQKENKELLHDCQDIISLPSEDGFYKNNLSEVYITSDLEFTTFESFVVIEHLTFSHCQRKGLILNFGFLERAEVDERNYEMNNINQLRNANDIFANLQYAMGPIKKNNSQNEEKIETLKIKDSIPSRESAEVDFKDVLTHRTTLSAKKLDKCLESYILLLDQLEEVSLSSSHRVQQILAKDETKIKSLSQSMDIQNKPLNMEFKDILEIKRSSQEWNKFENIFEDEDNYEIGSLNKWQHQRYIIAAPAFIIHLFKSNPAYQCSSIVAGAPNLYEELEQFYEMMAHPNSSLTKLIDVSAVQMRLKTILDRVKEQFAGRSWPKRWQHIVGKIQLRQLLTNKEKGAYEAMRWRLTDRSAQDISDKERLRDVLNAMLGYECRQLRYSFRTSQLLLRSPGQQHNLSESYLLLALGHLGCLYRELQHQQKQLPNLGKSGLALAQCQREEIYLYKQFHRKYKKLEKPATLFQLWKSSRYFSSIFEWILNLNSLIFEEANLLSTLSKELYQGNYTNLLQTWFLLVSQTMLENLSRWLRFGELSESKYTEFFITENLALPTENFWHGRFTLITKKVPLFLSNKLCDLIWNVGKCHRYSQEFLGIDIEVPLNYQRLTKAFQLTYLNHDMDPLNDLVAWVNEYISSYIFGQQEPAIDIFYKLFKYMLLRDLHFVTNLIDRLEPLLEQSVDLFDLQQFTSVLEQILTTDNSELYMVEISAEGSAEGFLCWSKFQLCWHLADNWKALIGQSVQTYSDMFPDLWKFHSANYILFERILRHKDYFGRRVELEYFDVVIQVEQRFQALIDLFISVMGDLRHYLLIQVLDEAYDQLKLKCNEAKTLDDIVQVHKQYLNAITMDLFLNENDRDCRICLNQIYHFVFDLDIEQQKFVCHCKKLIDYLRRFSDEERFSKCRLELHLTCKRTWNILNDLGRKFSINLVEFRANLNRNGERKFKLLAKNLNVNGLYRNATA